MANFYATSPANCLPATGYMRQAQVLGESAVTVKQAQENKACGKGPKRPRTGTPALVPVSSATWWRWVKSGKAPAPVRLSDRVTAWRAEDIRAFLDAQASASAT